MQAAILDDLMVAALTHDTPLERLLRAQNAAWARLLSSSIGHALGTGLQVIGGHASLLESAGGNPANEARVINRKVHEMTDVMQRILAYARGGLPPRDTATVAPLMDALKELSEPSAGARGQTLSVEISDENLTVHGRLDDILVALVGIAQLAIGASPTDAAIIFTVYGEVCEPPPSEAGIVAGGDCVVFQASFPGIQLALAQLTRPREPWLSPPAGMPTTDALHRALLYGLARENGGWVEWTQDPDATAVALKLPRTAA